MDYNHLTTTVRISLSGIMKMHEDQNLVKTINERIMFALIPIPKASQAVINDDSEREREQLCHTYMRLIYLAQWLKVDLTIKMNIEQAREARRIALEYFKTTAKGSALTAHLGIIRLLNDAQIPLDERLSMTLLWIEEYFSVNGWSLSGTLDTLATGYVEHTDPAYKQAPATTQELQG